MVVSSMFRAVHQLETVEWLMRTLGAGVPFAAVTGEVGVGKTVVVAQAAARLREAGHLVIEAGPPFAGPLELQASLAAGLDLATGTRTTPALVAAALRERPSAAGAVVLLVDGAEHLPPTVLQYLWLMHRLSGLGGPRLQTVFAGRFTFWERFADPELNDLRSEIAARFVLLPLEPDEAPAYVRQRLSAAGDAVATPITTRLVRQIVAEGQGIPLRLNAAADAVTRREPVRTRQLPALRIAPPIPARRRGWKVVALIGVAAGVLAGAALLSTQREPPLQTAALLAPPVMSARPQPAPPAAPPKPAVQPAPVAPSVAPSVASPAAPSVAPLPAAAMLRIALQYSSADPAAAVRAAAVAAQLRERGFLVDEPVATSGAAHGTVVEYYFAEDRDRAEQLARDLGGTASFGQLGGAHEPPPPGTIRIVLANAAVTLARSP